METPFNYAWRRDDEFSPGYTDLFIDSFCMPAYFVGLATFLLFLFLFILLEFSIMKKLDKLSGAKNYYKNLPFIYFFLSTAITIASYISKSPVVQG